MISLSNSQLKHTRSQSLDDLYSQLALANAGTSTHLDVSLNHLSAMQASIGAKALTSGGVVGWLQNEGEKVFNSIWPSIKSVVCQVYQAEQGANKDWEKAAATAILAAINVTGAVAILIVSIAIKLGLDQLCPAKTNPAAIKPARATKPKQK